MYINTPSMMISGWWDSNMMIRVWSYDLMLSVLLLSLPFHLLLTLPFTNFRVLSREEEEREVDSTVEDEGEGFT